MKYLMLVCAGRDVDPPETLGADTDAWVERADRDGGRTEGDRLRPPEEALVFQRSADGVEAVPGPRVTDDEQIVGFDVIDCPDLDSAVELLTAHPMARAGRIELRQLWD